MFDAEPELIADYACITGEGPLWHPDERRLYWLDIERGRIFRYDPQSGDHAIVFEGDKVGGMTLQDDGALLLFGARGAIRRWHNGALHSVVAEIPDERESRFNDVIADPLGGVFCGTMPSGERLGKLYRLGPDGELRVVNGAVGMPNGMGFTPDRRQLYHTDTRARVIFISDYDQTTGALQNQRVFARLDEQRGAPDGLTVDAAGYVWSASYGGGCLIRFAPDGAEAARVQLPAKNVTCALFGGDDYTDLYITTAGGENKAANGPGAGALFRLRLGIAGRPEFRSRVAVTR